MNRERQAVRVAVMGGEEAEIQRLYAANAAAMSRRDIPALVSFYTEDAIQFPPDRPPLVGREAIRSSLETELQGITIDAGIEVVETVIAGGWAYARGQYRICVEPAAGGRRTVTKGSWLDVLKREADGSWRIARSTWSTHGAERRA